VKLKSKKIKALILPLLILICWYLGSESGFFVWKWNAFRINWNWKLNCRI